MGLTHGVALDIWNPLSMFSCVLSISSLGWAYGTCHNKVTVLRPYSYPCNTVLVYVHLIDYCRYYYHYYYYLYVSLMVMLMDSELPPSLA